MSYTDLSDMALDDSHELHVLPAGSEVEIRIIDVKKDRDKNGLEYIMPRFEVVGDPYAADFSHFMHLPNKEEMDAKKLNRCKLALNTFLKAFGVDTGGRINFETDLSGLTGWAILGSRKDDEYGDQNTIRKWSVPK
jgi:hypothetical protein